jgi:glutamate--cysteine ligase
MTANRASTLTPTIDPTAARAHVASAALAPSPVGPVGLELEFHLVDLGQPERAVTWPELSELIDAIDALPLQSSITTEPGGQLELSGPPQRDIGDAIDALRSDQQILVEAVRQAGFGLASIGADPARPLRRVTPASRYAAMEEHFDAVGCGRPGREMMSSTAALQVNLNAGPEVMWAERVAHIHNLGPMLVAMSACSPMLAGRASGWRSMRQQAWCGIDPGRSRPVQDIEDPAQAWASYALDAPVMLVREPDGCAEAVTDRISFADWAAGSSPLRRLPTVEDLDYHLTTLFPPVRLRGYLEIRYLDAVPDRWWPALATIVTTLIDDPVAADGAAEACAGTGHGVDAWVRGARDGLRDPALLAAARRCVDIAARRCPAALRADVEAYAELVHRGRTPGDELHETAALRGPLAVLAEAADA